MRHRGPVPRAHHGCRTRGRHRHHGSPDTAGLVATDPGCRRRTDSNFRPENLGLAPQALFCRPFGAGDEGLRTGEVVSRIGIEYPPMATSLSNLLVHIVFSTKGRVPQIREEIREQLYGYIGGIVQTEGGILLEVGGMPDHVHLLVKIKADASVAVIVRLIKTNSSRWVNQTLGLPERFEWQTGYGAFSVSESKAATVSAAISRPRRSITHVCPSSRSTPLSWQSIASRMTNVICSVEILTSPRRC
jgi:putative transposase